VKSTRAAGGPAKRYAVTHPVTALCVVAIGLTLSLQTGLLLAGVDLFPGKLAELLFLTGTAALITSWTGGRVAVRRLFGGLTGWRIGAGRWVLLLLAMPTLTITVAAATGTLHTPDHGWAAEGLTYLALLVLILLTGSVWEETAWSGFVQRRLLDRHGLLVGSLLTAIPFGLIHLPLAFESDGWAGTTWSEALVNWAFLLGAAPFLRYVAGVLLVDTGGSVLAVAFLHASFNASGALSVVPGGWQYVPALVVLTALVVIQRLLRGRSLTQGSQSDLAPLPAVAGMSTTTHGGEAR
jgi:membrane protease YdiL (CAAX protease family)